jgi:hypothetical protein
MIDIMDPQKAFTEISRILKTLFSALGEEARSPVPCDLMGKSGADKVSNPVQL